MTCPLSLIVDFMWLTFSFSFVEDMSTLTPAQRVQFLEKARARKAQAEKEKAGDTVDALTQLEIGEVDKKKRKGALQEKSHIATLPLRQCSHNRRNVFIL
jgi:hypothetical protein